MDGELLDTIRLIAAIMDGMRRIDRWIDCKRKRLPHIRLLAQTGDSRSQIT